MSVNNIIQGQNKIIDSFKGSNKEMTRKEAINALKEMRKLYRGSPGDFNIREAILDGRKY